MSIDTRQKHHWLPAAVALAPIVVVYALHAGYAPSGFQPTGFIQPDQAYYIATAREMFDRGTFPLYALPFSLDDASPAMYFQPLTALLGASVQITRLDPGLVPCTVSPPA